MIKNIVICIILFTNIFANINQNKKTKADIILDETFELLKTSKFKKAFNKLYPLAKANNAKAMLAIANLYYKGKGVKKDYKKALKWYKKAVKVVVYMLNFLLQICIKMV